MCRSRTTQAGWCSGSDSKNSAPLGNVSTEKPADRSRRSRARRTDSSSSTTATSGDLGMERDPNGAAPAEELDLGPTSIAGWGSPDPGALGKAHELGKGPSLHLLHGPGPVDLDGFFDRSELDRDLLVALACHDMGQHFAL